MEVRFEIGPVDATAAEVWLSSSQEILRAIRRQPWGLSFTVQDPLLDLADMYVSIWRGVAVREQRFFWESVVHVDVVRDLATQWRSIGGLSDEEMAKIGATWPPDECRPFYDALLTGVVEALRQDDRTAELARDIAERPPGSL